MDEYAPRFPDYYKSNDDWDLVVDDVLMLEQLEGTTEGFLVGLGNESKGERLTRVKLYKTGGKVDLSDFMPILEALGLRVVEEVPTAMEGEGRVYIHDFGVLDSRGAVLELGEAAERVTDTIAAVWRGECDSDSLNRLVTLTLAHVVGDQDPPRAPQLPDARLGSLHRELPERRDGRLSSDLGALGPDVRSEVRSCPRRSLTRTSTRSGRRSTRISAVFRPSTRTTSFGISSGRSRRSCGRTSTCRTVRALSFKLQSERVPEMPKPTPLFEVWVYSTEMEAIHLRAGMVARGGIRWSDRREDFRTEVLGLMKAQKVKNAVIVPDGSKGGFVLKRTVGRAGAGEGGGGEAVRHLHGGSARHHRQPGEGRGRAPGRGTRDGRPRPVPRGRGRQGDRRPLRHGERRERAVRLLARRRLRVGRLPRLRPQGARHHGARGVGVGEAALP